MSATEAAIISPACISSALRFAMRSALAVPWRSPRVAVANVSLLPSACHFAHDESVVVVDLQGGAVAQALDQIAVGARRRKMGVEEARQGSFRTGDAVVCSSRPMRPLRSPIKPAARAFSRMSDMSWPPGGEGPCTATFIGALPGQLGQPATCVAMGTILSGSEGPNPIGTGRNASVGGVAQGPSGFDAGARGAANPVSTGAHNGNVGSAGYWIVDEFA